MARAKCASKIRKSGAYLKCARYSWCGIRVGNFRQKNYSAEDGIDGTIGLFRRNSGCSAEQKTLGIPFRTVPQRRRRLGILCHGTKIEANSRNSVLNHSAEQNSRNSVPNHSAEEKNARNSVPWKKNRNKLLEFRSQACLGQKQAVYSVCWSRIF
jgi:hypothetical protein